MGVVLGVSSDPDTYSGPSIIVSVKINVSFVKTHNFWVM